MLSHILTKVTGITLSDYLELKLFIHLGIRGVIWEMDNDGMNMGNGGTHMYISDMAKLGLFLIQGTGTACSCACCLDGRSHKTAYPTKTGTHSRRKRTGERRLVPGLRLPDLDGPQAFVPGHWRSEPVGHGDSRPGLHPGLPKQYFR